MRLNWFGDGIFQEEEDDVNGLILPWFEGKGCKDVDYEGLETDLLTELSVYRQQVKRGTYMAIQRNNTKVKNVNRQVPKLLVNLDGHPV